MQESIMSAQGVLKHIFLDKRNRGGGIDASDIRSLLSSSVWTSFSALINKAVSFVKRYLVLCAQHSLCCLPFLHANVSGCMCVSYARM